MPRPVIDESQCLTCGCCYIVCQVEGSVFEVTDKARVEKPDQCTGCGECVDICPTHAITLVE